MSETKITTKTPPTSSSEGQQEEDLRSAEKEEEAKLKAKYPSVARPGLLQKRLQKGQKYFDSGDYNMAKADVRKGRLPASALSHPPPPAPAPPVSPVGDRTGDIIPTPECLPGRKASIHVPSKLVTETS